jgi:hypothetical protein
MSPIRMRTVIRNQSPAESRTPSDVPAAYRSAIVIAAIRYEVSTFVRK